MALSKTLASKSNPYIDMGLMYIKMSECLDLHCFSQKCQRLIKFDTFMGLGLGLGLGLGFIIVS
jgi:hypothetical protein